MILENNLIMINMVFDTNLLITIEEHIKLR